MKCLLALLGNEAPQLAYFNDALHHFGTACYCDEAHFLSELWSNQGCNLHSASQARCSLRLQDDVVQKLQNKRVVECMVMQLWCEMASLPSPLRRPGGACNAFEKSSEDPAADQWNSIRRRLKLCSCLPCR